MTWIGVDLDGTLAHYEGWKGIDHIGAPIPAMVARVQDWIGRGLEVRIFTARVCGDDGTNGAEGVVDIRAADVAAARRYVQLWCALHIGLVLPVTNVKDYGMVELWDDRAVRVEKNTGRIL